jgi:hypothetical protein
MSSRVCISLATVIFALLCSTNARPVRARQELLTTEQTQIVNTMSTIFTVARTDDVVSSIPSLRPTLTYSTEVPGDRAARRSADGRRPVDNVNDQFDIAVHQCAPRMQALGYRIPSPGR